MPEPCHGGGWNLTPECPANWRIGETANTENLANDEHRFAHSPIRLRNRYKKRNWFTDSNFTTYEKVSIGATAKNYATAQLARAPGVWTTIAGPGGNQSAAFTKTAAGPLATQPKKMIQVKFHGETGLLADPGVH